MRDYILPSIIGMVQEKTNWKSGIDALNSLHNINWPSFLLVKDQDALSIFSQVRMGDKENVSSDRRQFIFKSIAELYFAKYLYFYDLPLNDKSLDEFLINFFGKEVLNDRIENSMLHHSDCVRGISNTQLHPTLQGTDCL